MPPDAVLCPCDKTNKFALNHWLAGRGCPLSPQARADYHSSLHRTLNDTRHCDGKVTITRLLSCPRQWLIADLLPYTFNPLLVNKMKIGTLVQEEIARFAEAVGAQAEVKVAGKLFGLDVSGSIDLLAGNLINEGKFHGEFRMDCIMGRGGGKKFNPHGPQLLSDDHVAQVNMQRLLLEQTEFTRAETPKADHFLVSHSSMNDPLWPSERVPVRDEEWIGNVRPCGGSFTVRQNAGFIANFKDELAQTTAVIESIKSAVPKVGLTCYVNKAGKSWACDNCAVRKECDEIG